MGPAWLCIRQSSDDVSPLDHRHSLILVREVPYRQLGSLRQSPELPRQIDRLLSSSTDNVSCYGRCSGQQAQMSEAMRLAFDICGLSQCANVL